MINIEIPLSLTELRTLSLKQINEYFALIKQKQAMEKTEIAKARNIQ